MLCGIRLIIFSQILEKTPRIIMLLVKLIVPGKHNDQRPKSWIEFIGIPVRALYGIEPSFFAFDETQSLVGLFTMHHGKIVRYLFGKLDSLTVQQTDNIGPYIIASCVLTVVSTLVISIKLIKNCGRSFVPRETFNIRSFLAQRCRMTFAEPSSWWFSWCHRWEELLRHDQWHSWNPSYSCNVKNRVKITFYDHVWIFSWRVEHSLEWDKSREKLEM